MSTPTFVFSPSGQEVRLWEVDLRLGHSSAFARPDTGRLIVSDRANLLERLGPYRKHRGSESFRVS